MSDQQEFKFKYLQTEQEVRSLIEYHNQHSDYVVLDTETTGLDYFRDRVTHIVLSGKEEDSAVLFAVGCAQALPRLNIPVVAHNFKFDFRMLLKHGVDLRCCGLRADTLLLDHLIDENVDHGLEEIVKREFGDEQAYKKAFWERNVTFSGAPREEQLQYACRDVLYTNRIYQLHMDRLRGSLPLVEHVHALALSLYDTELRGIKIDLPYLTNMGTILQNRIGDLRDGMRKEVAPYVDLWECEEWVRELDKRKTEKGKAGVKRPLFNFDSSKQVGELLYDYLSLPEQRSKKFRRTVDDAALANLEQSHSLIPMLREYREHQKIYTAFIEGTLEKMQDGRIHPSFNVNGTVTGRISSSSPNMQQLPREGGVRGIYVPDEGYRLISCDYSQLEVTLAAHFSRDKNLLKVVYEGASLHDITAQGLGIERQLAKTVNFALQYGAGVNKLKKILSCSEKDAEGALRKYWETYNGLKVFIDICHKKVEDGEPLVNLFGRCRRFPKVHSNKWDLERSKRQSFNAVIQGTGGDLTSRAFYLTNDALCAEQLGYALFPIHDEILIAAKENSCNKASKLLTSIMVGVGEEIKLTVPLKVECSEPMGRWES